VQGHAEAQSQLGMMYEAGRGVARNPVAAYKWLTLGRASARNEAVRAKAARALARVAGAMTPVQVAEAQRQAREWRPTPAKVRQP
ncbi:MAG: SEL1-like repeat protein, partial [Sphingomonadaceae bacterium]